MAEGQIFLDEADWINSDTLEMVILKITDRYKLKLSNAEVLPIKYNYETKLMYSKNYHIWCGSKQDKFRYEKINAVWERN